MQRLSGAATAFLFLFLAACGSESPGSAGETPSDAGDGDGDGQLSGGCATDAECDDGSYCNGDEVCDPDDTDADTQGCVPGEAPCGEAQTCSEEDELCLTDCDVTADADGDGFDAVECGGDDCDDGDSNRYPSNEEICDSLNHDEDCDPLTFGYRDQDQDDVADAACCNRDGDELICGDDCNDTDPGVSPRVPEVCDGLDNDCDDEIDEGVTRAAYQDSDGDGYGDPTMPVMAACGETEGVADNGLDCDDTSAEFRPGAAEICDGLDNNCDGIFERDLDKDGHLDPLSICAGDDLPKDDCNDLDPNTYAGAQEICDGLDNDCDLLTDEREEADLGCGERTGVLSGYCIERSCELALCEPLWGDCNLTASDGCETDLSTDSENCGECGRTCAYGGTCIDGVCDVPYFVDLDVGGDHACAVAATGGVGCWGENSSSQLGDKTLQDRNRMVSVIGFSGAVQVGAGTYHSCALMDDGDASCWGSNLYRGLGLPTTSTVIAPERVGLSLGDFLSTSQNNNCALVGSSAQCWGRMLLNAAEQVGPVTIDFGQDVISVDAKQHRYCAVLADGTAACVGWDSTDLGNGNLTGPDSCSFSVPNGGGTGSANCFRTPTAVSGLMGLEEIAGNCARDATKVWCWDDSSDLPTEALDVSGDGEVLAGLSSYDNVGFCAWTQSGALYCATDSFPHSEPPGVLIPTGVTDASVGADGFCALVGGQPRCAGSSNIKAQGQRPAPMLGVLPIKGVDPIVFVHPGTEDSCVLTASGRLSCWGSSGDFPSYDEDFAGLVQVDRDFQTTCGIDGLGVVRCKGYNNYGELGSSDAATFQTVSLAAPALDVSTNSSGTCAVLDTGEVVCWGRSSQGSLGPDLPANGNFNPPTLVSGIEHAVRVELGGRNTCILDAFGQVKCWGNGTTGQLGDGLGKSSSTPVDVDLFPDVLDLASGSNHSCALRRDGTVWCWGEGPGVGRGDQIANAPSPLPVPGLENVVDIVSSGNHTCALTKAGEATCWGGNISGQVPNGDVATTVDAFAFPYTIVDLTFRQLEVSLSNACGITVDGDVYCWGGNLNGQVSAFTLCPEVDIDTGQISIYEHACNTPTLVMGL